MPNWKKVIISGSDAQLNSLNLTNGATGSFTGSFIGDGSQLTGITATSSPGGSDSQIQYNNGGTTSGATNFVYDDINQRVGIGTASPSEKLHVSGRARITTIDNGTGDFTTISGTGVLTRRTPSQVLSDIGAQSSLTNPITGTGSSGQVSFFTGTTTQTGDNGLFWDNSNKRLGIGTTSPFTNFTIAGTTDSRIALVNPTTGTASSDGFVLICQHDTGVHFLNRENSEMRFSNNGSEKMRITSTGNVGIGNTTPASKLEVTGNVAIGYTNAAPTNGMIVNGDVGIGTTSPVTSLDVTKVTPSITTFFPYLQLSQRGTVANSKTGISFRNTEYNWDMGKISTERNGSSNSFDFVIYTALSGADNERMRITSAGNVGIGTTSPVGKLFINNHWRTTYGGGNLFVGSGGTNITSTTDLGITYTVSDATTTKPNKVGLTLYNDDTTAGGWSPMMLFSKAESGTSNFKATMAGIAAKAPLGTGNNGDWIDGELHFYTSGAATSGLAQRMVLDKEGNLGIGNTSPASKLEVTGNVAIGYTSAAPANGMIVSGDVGIGTTSPSEKLEVNGDIRLSGNTRTVDLARGTTSSQSKIIVGEQGRYGVALRWDSGSKAHFDRWWNTSIDGPPSSQMITLDASNDRVGIGTTSPSEKLEVNGNTLISGGNRKLEFSGGWGKIEALNGTLYLNYNNPQNGINFAQNKVFIEGGSGDVGINTTSPDEKLDVNGNIKLNNSLLSNQQNTDVDTGTETVATVSSSTYDGAFFDYVIKNGTNLRAGTVIAVHDGTNVSFTETSTQDLGNTTDLELSVDLSGGDIRLRATASSNNWSIKTIIRAL